MYTIYSPFERAFMLVRPYQYWKSSQIEPKKIGWNAIRRSRSQTWNLKLKAEKKIQSVTERGFQVPVSLWIFYDETKVVVQELKCFIIKNEKWSQIIITDDKPHKNVV